MNVREQRRGLTGIDHQQDLSITSLCMHLGNGICQVLSNDHLSPISSSHTGAICFRKEILLILETQKLVSSMPSHEDQDFAVPLRQHAFRSGNRRFVSS